jgi:hypothetical protein
MTRHIPTPAQADARLYAAIMSAEDTIDPHAAPITEPKPVDPPKPRPSMFHRITTVADHLDAAALERNADDRANKLRLAMLLLTGILRDMNSNRAERN